MEHILCAILKLYIYVYLLLSFKLNTIYQVDVAYLKSLLQPPPVKTKHYNAVYCWIPDLENQEL